MKACDTLWGYRAVDQWLAESTRLHRTAWEYLFSLRNGFTAYNVLSPENGSFASVAPRETVASGCIDASTATPGPHAFAVRFSRDRQSQLRRPPLPAPRCDDGQRPSEWDGIEVDIVLIWPSGKAKYFSFRGLTHLPKIGNDLPRLRQGYAGRSRRANLLRLLSPHRHCLRQTQRVCARERSDEAIHFAAWRKMDCFASLAMTQEDGLAVSTASPACGRIACRRI
jgi:hypothetical protein